MVLATVTSKGQVTIPVAVRKKLRLKSGSKVDFIENKAGETVLKPRQGDIRRLRGFIKYDGPPVSVEEMNEAVAKAAVERFEGSAS
jgi:antitoxin PrlF